MRYAIETYFVLMFIIFVPIVIQDLIKMNITVYERKIKELHLINDCSW